MVGIFPNETSILRLIGAVLLEANDEWQLQHRHMQLEAMAELLTPELGTLKLPPTGLARSPGGMSAALTGASTALGGLLAATPLEIGWKAIWPSMVAAALRQAFLQPDRTAAGQT